MTDNLHPEPRQEPLRDRVAGARRTVVPAHPEIASWRPVTLDDVDLLTEFEHALAAADHPEWRSSRDEVADMLGRSELDLERDTLLGFAADGRLAAHGLVLSPAEAELMVRSFVFGGVHPDFRGRGIGRVLLDWELARAVEQFSTSDSLLPGVVFGYAQERTPAHRRLLERAGMEAKRWFLKFSRDLREPLPEVPEADAAVRPYRDEDAEAVRHARNDAFRDHWGSDVMSSEQWGHLVGAEGFRGDLSLVSVDGDRVVGFLLASEYEATDAHEGETGIYVEYVGVRREGRGRGIARRLLAGHLHAAAGAGFTSSVLEVDADSPTGANALYESMGYREKHRELAYSLEY
ncbi:putative acetyltransferase, GNAT [Agromyces rhizosphaerae]|uniref:Acetyltransferase, GNAT n=1 Tax=Agromyces rhizosphaerae TaxID=88374 RepID=A0A9W6CWQ9_9MICO|nr:GNAT family N-acetyltransferase [Agromyces rhizosphaerae]GLI27987.1 putative acetyltransferase, GNAT [Agromyces rhizosphaerae]